MSETVTLYRPVGLKELQLIQRADMRAFPPRLAHQPIFYPVLNLAYAEQIARDWNTRDSASDYAGFVTAFDVDRLYVEQFEVQTVGASHHQELWIPAERLDELNRQIRGEIRVVGAYYGDQFVGERL